MKKRYIVAIVLIVILASCVGMRLEAGRCEVVLKRYGAPLAGATITVHLISDSRCMVHEVSDPGWKGTYTLDAQGRWDMGWHLFDRPKDLLISINDEKWKSWNLYAFTFPAENGWTVDFCGPTTTRTRERKFLFIRFTKTTSVTNLGPAKETGDSK